MKKPENLDSLAFFILKNLLSNVKLCISLYLLLTDAKVSKDIPQ
ncbi:hypothetical protein QE431_002421 [Flavobacterium sp. SORGH_AS 622]|nr:hypothetical protein [Flavobacterium sp. SORGH_AS_0622]